MAVVHDGERIPMMGISIVRIEFQSGLKQIIGRRKIPQPIEGVEGKRGEASRMVGLSRENGTGCCQREGITLVLRKNAILHGKIVSLRQCGARIGETWLKGKCLLEQGDSAAEPVCGAQIHMEKAPMVEAVRVVGNSGLRTICFRP